MGESPGSPITPEDIMKDMPVIHASRTGLGPRAIAMELLGYQQDPIDEKTQKIFDDGNKFEEPAIKQVLHDIKYNRPHEAKEDRLEFEVKLKSGINFLITCSNDAVLLEEFDDDGEVYPVGTVIEVKNVGKNSFRKYFSQKRLPLKYKAQVQAYLWAHKKSHEGKLYEVTNEYNKKGKVSKSFRELVDPLPYEKALFIVRCKETRECRAFPVKWDDKVMKQMLQDCSEAVKHFQEGTLPSCDCSNHFCRFKVACKKGKKANPEELFKAFYFNVVGVTFRKTDLRQLIEMEVPEKNMAVSLVPEPDNPFDANAIKVVVNNLHVGFVPKEYQEHINELLAEKYIPRVFNLADREEKPFIHIILFERR